MSTFITFKRWTLRDGRQESELVRLVREEIVPHYRTLPGCMRLGLLHIVDTRSYLTLQYWKNRDVWQETTNSAYHEVWQREYEPIVERFAEIMIFEAEWECEDMGSMSGGEEVREL